MRRIILAAALAAATNTPARADDDEEWVKIAAGMSLFVHCMMQRHEAATVDDLRNLSLAEIASGMKSCRDSWGPEMNFLGANPDAGSLGAVVYWALVMQAIHRQRVGDDI